MLSTRKPTASGSRPAKRQDSEEEARSADADAQNRIGKGKYWLEKVAEMGEKKRVTESEGKSLTLEKNACFWLQRELNSMVKELTETSVLFLLTSSPAAPNALGHQGLVLWKTIFPWPGVEASGLEMIQAQ